MMAPAANPGDSGGNGVSHQPTEVIQPSPTVPFAGLTAAAGPTAVNTAQVVSHAVGHGLSDKELDSNQRVVLELEGVC